MRDFPFGFPPRMGPMVACGPSFGRGFGAFDGALGAHAMRGPFPPPPFGTNYGPFPHMEWNREHSDHQESHHHGPICHNEHNGLHEDGCRLRCGTQKPGSNRRDFRSCHHDPRPCRHRQNEENPQENQFGHHEEGFGHFCPRMWSRNGPGHHGPWRRHEPHEGLLFEPYCRGGWPHGDRLGLFGVRGRGNHHQSRGARRECCSDQPRCQGRGNCCKNAGMSGRRASPCRDRSEGRREREHNTRSPCMENQETVLVQKIVVDKNPRCYSV